MNPLNFCMVKNRQWDNGENRIMKYVLDASRMTDKETAHAYLKEVLELPDYYGNNLDALHDCLEEMSDVEIVVENEEEAGNYYRYVARVLREIE